MGDSHLAQLRDMLESMCKLHGRECQLDSTTILPDVEFFINKRDHPQLKRDLTEPYDFIFAPDPSPQILRARFGSYAPIFYTIVVILLLIYHFLCQRTGLLLLETCTQRVSC